MKYINKRININHLDIHYKCSDSIVISFSPFRLIHTALFSISKITLDYLSKIITKILTRFFFRKVYTCAVKIAYSYIFTKVINEIR